MITKSTMIVIFNLKNSHLLTLSLLTEDVFQVNGLNQPVANLPVVDFHSQPREMPTPKPLWFSSPSRKVWTSPSISDMNLFCVFATITRESSDKLLVLRIAKALPFIYQPDCVAPKTSDVLSGDWLINTREKVRYFFTCVVTAFLRARNPCITPQFMW